ncbi:hypothetical protein [Aquicoccus sp.]|uniref:hypothetical protein n=1 Tax=Aquicoccus sp. TaxID=2055851 RepID=UPI003569B4AF
MARENKSKPTVGRALLALVFLSVGLGGCLLAFTPSEEEIAAQEAERAADPTSRSKAACREFIKGVLVSPSSADFEHFAGWPAHETDSGAIRVNATLNAQNAYGATIRQTMTCEVRKADGQWHLESLTED